MGMGIDRDRIRQIVAEAVEGQGYELVDLELRGAGNSSVIRIFIDKPDGISHQDCGLVSEQVGTVLDVEDVIPYRYTLEVSSPGLDRKLVRESDYTRFEGRLAKIQTRIPLQHQKVFKGRLKGLRDGRVVLEGPQGNLQEIPMDVIQEARLEFKWPEPKE
jgi:ribosome maturation factor RimP